MHPAIDDLPGDTVFVVLPVRKHCKTVMIKFYNKNVMRISIASSTPYTVRPPLLALPKNIVLKPRSCRCSYGVFILLLFGLLLFSVIYGQSLVLSAIYA